ncbi:SWI/SNF chromatin-remodeling complex subunit sol1 [Verticillium dahliae VDG2]|nr:SWI/SNF chromatin-remodeling complex subunit sol1 [Verticillium dahliae VDG2]
MRSLQTFMTIQAAFSTLVHGQDEQALIQMTWPDANESFYSVINGKKVTHNGGHDDWGLSSRNFQCSDVNPPSDAKRTLLSIDGFHVQLSQMWDSKTVSSSFEIGRWMIDWSFGQFEGLDGANATAFAWSNGLYYDGLSDLGVTCGDRLLAPNSYGIPNWEEEGIVDIFQVEPGRWNGVNATLVRLRPVHNRPSSCIALSGWHTNNQDYIKRVTRIYSSNSNWLFLGPRDATHQHKRQ